MRRIRTAADALAAFNEAARTTFNRWYDAAPADEDEAWAAYEAAAEQAREADRTVRSLTA
jgi:hypothetical protein